MTWVQALNLTPTCFHTTNKYTNGGSGGLGAGNSVKVDFTLNYSASLAEDLAGLAGSGNFGFTGSTSAVDLLNEAVFGTPSF